MTSNTLLYKIINLLIFEAQMDHTGYFFNCSHPKNSKCQSVSKFWRLELFRLDLLCNLTLGNFRGGAIKKPPCMLFRYSLYQVPFTKPAKKMPLFYIGVDHYFSVCMFLSLEIHGKFRGTSWTIVMLIFVKHEPFNFQMATKHNSQASPSPPWGF